MHAYRTPMYTLGDGFGIEYPCDKSLGAAGLDDGPAPIAYSAVKCCSVVSSSWFARQI